MRELDTERTETGCLPIEPLDSAPTVLVLAPEIEFLGGAEAGTIVPMCQHELILGRDRTCDVVLEEGEISAFHARLTRSSDGIVIHDLNSRNGTFVNATRLGGRAASVCSSSLVSLGRAVLLRLRAVEADSFEQRPLADTLRALSESDGGRPMEAFLAFVKIDHLAHLAASCPPLLLRDMLGCLALHIRRHLESADMLVCSDLHFVVLARRPARLRRTFCSNLNIDISSVAQAVGLNADALSVSVAIVPIPAGEFDAPTFLLAAKMGMYQALATGRGRHVEVRPGDRRRRL